MEECKISKFNLLLDHVFITKNIDYSTIEMLDSKTSTERIELTDNDIIHQIASLPIVLKTGKTVNLSIYDNKTPAIMANDFCLKNSYSINDPIYDEILRKIKTFLGISSPQKKT